MSRNLRSASSSGRRADEGSFRIIGGRWRGRRLRFPAVPGVRPTGDRVRETLFNWLQPVIAGARCLDLYAGSGALGLEALSRGAAEVVFVDKQAKLIRALRDHLEMLGAEGAGCICEDAANYLSGPGRPFDLILLDPPYGTAEWPDLCNALVEGGWLADGGRVYLEDAANVPEPVLPPGWSLRRSAKAGNVRYHLACFRPARSPADAAEST